MRGYRRRWRPIRLVLAALALLSLAYGLIQFSTRSLAPAVRATARIKAQALAHELINRVVVDQVASGLSYKDLVDVHTDGQGRVTFLQTNAMVAGRVMARAVEAIEGELRRVKTVRFGVPLGHVLGNWFLADLGPEVPISLRPVGAVTAGVRQRFEEAGINQTRHIIALEARVRMQVVLPLQTDEVLVTEEFPLSEAVIVGQVPSSYWRGDLGGRVAPAPGQAPGAGDGAPPAAKPESGR